MSESVESTIQLRNRLHPVHEVASVLGISYRETLRLIRTKKLRAKNQIIRGAGKRPRKFVLTCDLEHYIKSLPDAVKDAPKRRASQRKQGAGENPLADVIEFV